MTQKEISLQQKIEGLLHNKAISRRRFIAGVSATAAISIFPLSGCKPKTIVTVPFQFAPAQFTSLAAVQNHLFPHEKDAPGAEDIHAAAYLQTTLGQAGFDPEIRDFVVSGITQLQDYLREKSLPAFEALSAEQRENSLQAIQELTWGANWLSILLTYIFEALLSDPVYGGNPNEIGWKWLDHIPGLPRPSESSRYGAAVNQETIRL